jgi:hypothetical protein
MGRFRHISPEDDMTPHDFACKATVDARESAVILVTHLPPLDITYSARVTGNKITFEFSPSLIRTFLKCITLARLRADFVSEFTISLLIRNNIKLYLFRPGFASSTLSSINYDATYSGH